MQIVTTVDINIYIYIQCILLEFYWCGNRPEESLLGMLETEFPEKNGIWVVTLPCMNLLY